MNADFIEALNALQEEKNIDKQELIEAIEILLVFNKGRTGEIIEFFNTAARDASVDRLQECQVLLERHWNFGATQLVEESGEHGLYHTRQMRWRKQHRLTLASA